MKATIIKPVKVVLKKKLIEPLKEIPPMAHWHPAKVVALVGIVTLFVTIGGSVLTFQTQFGKVLAAIATHDKRLDDHRNQIVASEKRMDTIETTVEGVHQRQIDIWELLKEMRTTQMRNFAVSSDNNKILKSNGGGK
jgi:hypothetical protein